MNKQTTNDARVEVLNFANQNIPEPFEPKMNNDSNFVQYGLNNLYPNYLLRLFTECGIHASIIQNKTNYIIGDGLKLEGNKDLDIMVNPSDNIKEFSFKITMDYLLFHYFAVEVIYSALGTPIEFHHVPAHKIRSNKSKTKFWYCDDWSIGGTKIIYDRWTPQPKDKKSKIFFFDGYFPSINNVYTRPEYAGAISSIESDIALKSFNLNNIKNHFSVSTLITFFMGSNVSNEVKQKVIDDINQTYKGENGKKIIIDFQNPNNKSAEVKNLSAGDWDKAYIEVSKKVIDDILQSHQVTSPMLFGLKTEGQLGGNTELETAFHVFKNTYVRVKRDAVESALNTLFAGFEGINGKVHFGDKQLFDLEVSETIKLRVYTIDELRKEAGLPPLPNGAGAKLLNEVPHVSENVSGTTPTTLGEDVKKKDSRQLTEEDYELIKHLGIHADEFEDVEESLALHFDKQSDIADYIINNDIKNVTLDELVQMLNDADINIGLEDLQTTLKDLNDSGVVKVSTDSNNRLKITPNTTGEVPKTDTVLVMYKYIKRPEISGGDLLPTSRSFCVKLIENNRYYTMEDIQSMSEIFNYDVFDFCGGFYFNPETQETTSHCRHMWTPLRVKRKTNNE